MTISYKKFCIKKFCVYCELDAAIDSLHELQNLYVALTSEELDVVNIMSENNNPVNISPGIN